MRFSIIIPAYKEKEINKVLRLLLKQTLPKNWKLDKIFVVACGYENFHFLKNRKIQVIKETRRKGKAYAMNLALKRAKSSPKLDVIVIHNADVFPKKNMLKNLFRVFENDNIGIACVRPVPLDKSENFLGFLNNMVWELHHLVSLKSPKVGEVFAFRNIVKNIPKRLATDEAYIESIIRNSGYEIVYVPTSIVFNNGADNISDFINHRRRIFTGHTHVKSRYGYEVSTMNNVRIVKSLLEYLKMKPIKNYKQMFWLVYAILLESYARLLGVIDFYIFNEVPYVWKIVKNHS